MLKDIEIIPIKDGGNPRTKFEIDKKEKSFFIHPFSEDDDGNYRFRLKVKIINKSNKTIRVPINIKWGDKEHQEHRNYLLLSVKENQWKKFNGKIDGNQTRTVIEMPSGGGVLSLHPSYGFERLKKFVKILPTERFKTEIIGKSRRNRDIIAIKAGWEDYKPLAVVARVHPYETIGNYFVDGMLKWLMSKDNDAQDFLENNHVVFIPMPNPDGVAEGTCKLTLGGFNFEAGYGDKTSEPEGAAIREYFNNIKPKAIFDLHGWMYDFDFFATSDTERGKKLYASLTDNERLFNKGIEIKYRMGLGRTKNILECIGDKLGVVYFDSSWCWYDRNAKDLHDMGVSILKAYAGLY